MRTCQSVVEDSPRLIKTLLHPQRHDLHSQSVLVARILFEDLGKHDKQLVRVSSLKQQFRLLGQ
jgi:hypothetical protein